MHHQDNPEGACLPPEEEDRQIETTILALVLDEHPAQLSVIELSLALNSAREDFESEDAVERGIRELVGAGLLRCRSALVSPSRAVLYLRRLEQA